MATEQNLEGDEGIQELQLKLSVLNGAGTKALTDFNNQTDKFVKAIETLPNQLKMVTEGFTREVQQLSKVAEILKSPTHQAGQGQLFGQVGGHQQLRDYRGRFMKGPQPEPQQTGISNEDAELAQEEAKNSQEQINNASRGPKSYARNIAEMHWRHPLGLLHARRFLGPSVSGNLHTFAHGSAAMADWVTGLQQQQKQAEEKGESPDFNFYQRWGVNQNPEQMGAWAQKAKLAALGLGTAGGLLGFEGAKRSLGEFGHPMNWNMIGASLGANREGGPFSGIPILGPLFSPASSVGLEQTAEVIGNALTHPGLNLMQSERIRTALNQSGFGGQLGEEISNKALIPGFQKYGMNPEAFVQGFERTLRNNPGSLNKIVESLGDLGEQAEKTHMTLTQTVQDIAEVNRQFEESGGAPGQGAKWASLFHEATGMKASEGMSALTSPLVTATLGQMTGTPAFAQRSLPAGTQMAALFHSINMLAPMFEQGEPEITRKEGMSRKDYAASLLQQYMPGSSFAQIKNLMKHAKAGEEGALFDKNILSPMLNSLTNKENIQPGEVQKYINTHGLFRDQESTQKGAFDLVGGAISGLENALGVGGEPSLGHAISSLAPANKHERLKNLHVLNYDPESQKAEVRLQNGHIEEIPISLSDLHIAMGQAPNANLKTLKKGFGKYLSGGLFKGESHKELEKLRKISDPQKRIETLQKDIYAKTKSKSEKPTITVEIKEPGQKTRKGVGTLGGDWSAIQSEMETRAGGPASNSLYASSVGLRPLQPGGAELPEE